VEFVSRKLT